MLSSVFKSFVRRLGLCLLTCAPGIGVAFVVLILGQPTRTVLAVHESSQPVSVPAEIHSPEGLSPTPDWVATGESTGDTFGSFAAAAGDVNGDGYGDVIIGAPNYMSYTGRAYLYLGTPTGLSLTPAFTVTGDGPQNQLGIPAGTAGDVNGDGYSDVWISAARVFTSTAGYVLIYHGSATGLNPTPALTLTGENSSQFGIGSGTAGDVNGDGYSDVIIGAHTLLTNTGQVYLYLGSASGLNPTPVFTATGEGANNYFGFAAGTAGDVDGDGYGDVLVGAFGYYTNTGRVYLYSGAAAGLNSTPALMLTGELNDEFGFYAGTAGDVNGDGYSDVAIGTLAGKAYFYLGSASGLNATPAFTHTQNSLRAAATAGDINGDGFADVIFGAPSPVTSSQATVYFGSSTGLHVSRSITLTDGENASAFGFAVGTAGDVNGDGYADLLIGAHQHQNFTGRAYVYHGGPEAVLNSPALIITGAVSDNDFGNSVGTAGDVNGDGYTDVVIGAPGYMSNTGRAYVYLGSADGLSPVPVFTATGEGTNNYFGFPAETAGDVNGDGYDDVIIGASGLPFSTLGRAYLYLGSSAGLNATPALTMTGDPPGDGFGSQVGTAGDVNGDGYSDLLISRANIAHVYHGSANGINLTPVFTAPTFASPLIAAGTAGDVNGDGYADIVLGEYGYFSSTGQVKVYLGSSAGALATPVFTATGLALGERFGFSVGTAGDINGDGYADIVIAAEGRENIYLGSGDGPESTPAFTVTHSAGDLYTVGTAGDVNADGYADVILGNRWGLITEGVVVVYLGSATGLSAAPITLTEGITVTQLGMSVSTAGDVNGDGYAEVIAGGPYTAALLFAGNAAYGLPLVPQQRRADDSAPIAHNGQSDSADSFRLAAVGRTPFGRGLVKLEWEVKPLGAPFDGTGLGQSAAWLDTDVAGVALNELVTGLIANTQYHWRVRLRYHPASTPFQQYSRWITQPWNGWQEADLRTADAPIIRLYLPVISR